MDRLIGQGKELLSDGLTSIVSFESKPIEEGIQFWSTSLWSKLTYNNLQEYLNGIGISFEPRNVESKLSVWSRSIWEFVDQNPILFSRPYGKEVQTYVYVPFAGPVSLDVFLFVSSAVVSRSYMFWRDRRYGSDGRNGSGKRSDDTSSRRNKRSSPVKATIVKGYKDRSLYKTIHECANVKKSLRKVPDPDVARKHKRLALARQNAHDKLSRGQSKSSYLGMSPSNLQNARKILREVDQSHRK